MKPTQARVLLTGATGGIGRAMAQRLLRDGASVMLVARSASSLATLSRALAQHVFKMDLEKVRVISHDVGGGFGQKGIQYAEDMLVPFAARDFVLCVLSDKAVGYSPEEAVRDRPQEAEAFFAWREAAVHRIGKSAKI